MEQEIEKVQKELESIKKHREQLLNYLNCTKLTVGEAKRLLNDGKYNAVEYADVIKKIETVLLTDQELSSLVVQKLSAYNPGDIPLETFLEALIHTDRSRTLYLYASYIFIALIPDEEIDKISRIVDRISSELSKSYPMTEEGKAFQKIVDSIKDLLCRKHYVL